MRRLVLSTILAASAVSFGACSGTTTTTSPNKVENKPVSTPAPVTPASPMTNPSPVASVDPKASPAKPGASPEVKKTDGKTDDKAKEVKPAAVETPKK